MPRQWIALSTGFPSDLETLSLSVEHRYAWVVLLALVKLNKWNGVVNRTAMDPLMMAYTGLSTRKLGFFYRAVTDLGWLVVRGREMDVTGWKQWQKDPTASRRAHEYRHKNKRDGNSSEIAPTGTSSSYEEEEGDKNDPRKSRFFVAGLSGRGFLIPPGTKFPLVDHPKKPAERLHEYVDRLIDSGLAPSETIGPA